MTLVVDASVVVSALIDAGPQGAWAETALLSDHLAAPHLLPVEAASALRRAVFAGRISADVAALAHADLLQLRITLFPYEPFADRVWRLRESVTTYDAWYVSLAEALASPLATLDHRLTAASGPACEFLSPPGD